MISRLIAIHQLHYAYELYVYFNLDIPYSHNAV